MRRSVYSVLGTPYSVRDWSLAVRVAAVQRHDPGVHRPEVLGQGAGEARQLVGAVVGRLQHEAGHEGPPHQGGEVERLRVGVRLEQPLELAVAEGAEAAGPVRTGGAALLGGGHGGTETEGADRDDGGQADAGRALDEADEPGQGGAEAVVG